MVTFISGNEQKIKLYTMLLAEHGVSFSSQKIPLDEIQSDSLEQIVEHKARQAFEQLKQPLFVQDAGWSVPALKGFPGPFMKYMNQWLSSEDFLMLMQNKADKTVLLVDYFGCMDARGTFSILSATYPAHFVDSPVGEGSSIDRVVALEGFDRPLSLTPLEERQTLFAKADVWGRLAEWIKL